MFDAADATHDESGVAAAAAAAAAVEVMDGDVVLDVVVEAIDASDDNEGAAKDIIRVCAWQPEVTVGGSEENANMYSFPDSQAALYWSISYD